MKAIVGCEYSGTVGEALLKEGWDVVTCDLLPSENGIVRHYQGDVRILLMKEKFDLGIFHPPCTRLCNSGVRWLNERDLWKEMREGALFFKECLNADIPFIIVENPIPHKYALEIIGRRYDQIIQPWMFGHGETKATCLWLKNLPLLKPTNIVEGREGKIWKMPPGQNRGLERSRTYQGIAKAIAKQYSDFLGVGKHYLSDEKRPLKRNI